MPSGLPLSARDQSRLGTALLELYAIRDRASLIDYILELLPALIDADLFSYIEADPVAGRFAAVRKPVPDSEEMLDIFAPMAPEHPIIRHAAESGTREAFRVGDFLTTRQWRSLPMYSEFMRPERIEHQLGVPLDVNPAVMTFLAAHRSGGRDFSQRDRAMLSHLAPHAARALLNADVVSRVDHGGEVIEATCAGRIRWTTALSRKWLGDYFGEDARRSDRLPAPLRGLPAAPPGRVAAPLVFERGSRRLVVRRFVRPTAVLLVLGEDELSAPRFLLEQLGLSRREIDVVVWLTVGKTNEQIADILGISPLTVKKHLGRVFEKLGVDSRTAAALRVRELASTPSRA